MNVFYCYPKCSTCKKAQQFLEENDISYQLKDIKITPPPEEDIKLWLMDNKVELKKLWNTSGILYREKNLKELLPTLSIEEQISLLVSDGMLIKRQLFISDDFILVGFKEKEWEDRLCQKN